MLAAHLKAIAAERPEAPAVIAGEATTTYGGLAAKAAALSLAWQGLRGQRVGLALADPLQHIAGVAALDALECHAFLAGPRHRDELIQLAREFAWRAIVTDAGTPPEFLGDAPGPGVGEARVTLLTSGTSGRPKAANHSWHTLAAPVRRDPRYARTRWLCAYPLNLYAGTQVMLQALLNGATLVIPAALDPEVVAHTLNAARVTHASGTPTFWRRLVLFGPREQLAGCSLEQITLGGEATPQALLDQLATVFPHTRLVHIYASTELGRLFTVTDRREGFPAVYLEHPPEPGIELRIIDGELAARSRNAMLGYEAGAQPPSTAEWFPTGDLVEVQADRVLFRGRASDLINVGGRKVMPAAVEAVLRDADGVADVRVFAKRSSLVGELVAADVVVAGGRSEQEVRDAIDRLARARLAAHEIPRMVRVVDSIAHNRAFKVVRSERE